jgi:hypothetical protein
MSDLSCARMRELAPELALDVLTGYERATAQAHLGMCAPCREYVSSLTQIGDRMLTLVPGVEPPVGFEDRALARMGLTAPPAQAPRRRWWPMALVAASVAAVVFGFGGWMAADMTTDGTPVAASGTAHQVLRFAQLRNSSQRQIGQVFTYEGSPSWVWMSIAMTDANVGTVWCELQTLDGKVIPIGEFPLSGGKGSWGAQIKVDPNTVVGARLTSDQGNVLASASFDPVYPPLTQGPK